MSEQTEAPDNGGEQAGFTPPATQDELNAIIAKRIERERAKFANYDDLKQRATKFDELEQANKSDLERLQSQFSEVETRAGAAEAELTRLRIATKYGISEDDLDLLGSGSEEEISARAERIKALTAPVEPDARRELHVAGEGRSPDIALNGSGVEDALKSALGIA